MKYLSIILIGALLVPLQTSSAQKRGLIDLSFCVYGLQPGDYSNIFYQDAGGKIKPLKFNRKSKSKTYSAKVRADAPALRFLHKLPNPRTEQSADYIHLQTITLRPEAQNLFFVFVRAANVGNTRGFQIYPVEENDSSPKGGAIRIMNLTGIKLLGLSDGERFELPALACSQALHSSGNRHKDIAIFKKHASRYHLVYRNELRISSGENAILFLTPPYREASLKLGGQMLYEEL